MLHRGNTTTSPVMKSELKQKITRSPSLPFRLPVEQSARWVDIDYLLINERPITFLGILLGRISEEATADGLLDSNCCLPAGHHIQLVPARQERERKRGFSRCGCSYQQQMSTFSLATSAKIVRKQSCYLSLACSPVHNAQHLLADVLRSA